MADDLLTDDESGAHAGRDSAGAGAKTDKEFGIDFEFDTNGLEPGLELDRSALEPPAPASVAPAPGPQPASSPSQPSEPVPARPSVRSAPARQAGGRPLPAPPAGLNPVVLRALAVGVAVIVIALVVASLKSEPDPQPNPAPQIALEEGERAIHQGKWVDALKAFQRLQRFPNSAEATAVRERGLEEKAFVQIMQAEPSATAARRLEELSELYPERIEVRDRLGEVRKALSSGARGGATNNDPAD